VTKENKERKGGRDVSINGLWGRKKTGVIRPTWRFHPEQNEGRKKRSPDHIKGETLKRGNTSSLSRWIWIAQKKR